jgi:hypothetical protein
MSARREQELRSAIAAFGNAWRDETDRCPSELEAARPERLAELEQVLGAPLPPSVRTLLEVFDGSFVPVSPQRPDTVLFALAISMQLSSVERRDVVPIIECGNDPETGLNRLLGVAVDDPWGRLKQGLGDSYDTQTVTLVEWFEQVTAENRTYVWPAWREIMPVAEWSSRTEIAESELATMPVGAAIATYVPAAKRNRVQLRLRVHLEPGIWAESQARRDDEPLSVLELIARARAHMERVILRARSQWELTLASFSQEYAASERKQYFVGSVEIA